MDFVYQHRLDHDLKVNQQLLDNYQVLLAKEKKNDFVRNSENEYVHVMMSIQVY